jgi:hypothetical protein
MRRKRHRRRKEGHRFRRIRAGGVQRVPAAQASVKPLHRLACYAWAAPTTLVGLLGGALALGSGGSVQRCCGALEFYGGFARWFADRIGFDAMTLGHVILGRDALRLELLRDHEQAHVRQAEMWGPAFIPAYMAASLLAWARGDHYYRDNWFERDARRTCGERN